MGTGLHSRKKKIRKQKDLLQTWALLKHTIRGIADLLEQPKIAFARQ